MKEQKLQDKDRFSFFEKEKKLWLKKLSFKKGLILQENLLSSGFIWRLRKNFFPDNPVCLKNGLKDKP